MIYFKIFGLMCLEVLRDGLLRLMGGQRLS